jgi:hypothetical protein
VARAVSRGGSPVTAALATAHGALNKLRLVVTGAPDLSALVGARAGTIGVTLQTKKHKDEHEPLEIKGARGKCYSPQVGEALLPLPQGFRGHQRAPAALAGSSTNNPVAGASALTTGANSTAASVARGDGGGGIHLSGGTPPVTLLLLVVR